MRKKVEILLKKALRLSSQPSRGFGGQAGQAAEIFVPENEKFGHYSTNAALKLAKERKKNPLKVAESIVEKIKKISPEGFFEKIEVAPPGFINFWVSRDAIRKELLSIASEGENYGRSNYGKDKKIIIEYSSPNVAKPMHVGHLRSAVIGDALANIHEFLGYKVVRWNYIGDWGTQFGKLIAAYKRWGNRKKVESSPVEELSSLYVRFHKEEEANPLFAEEGREEFMKLESGDAENRKLWKWFRSESLGEFGKIYKELGMKFDVAVGESFFEPALKPLVESFYKKGILKESEGALVVPLDKFNLPPALVRKSDESSLYLTRDLACLDYRLKKYKPLKIIYVVSNEQTLHFSQLFAVAEIAKMKKAELAHVKFGLVLGERGKFSTRTGEAISLDELLDKSVSLARKIVEEKNPRLAAKEKKKIAEAVGVGAVKYNDLKENRLSDIYFDWDKMLDFSGDSAPYLQYTYARLKSILRKVSSIKYQVSGVKSIGLLTDGQELLLIRKMAEFPEIARRAAENMVPNIVAKYLYELANAANGYYESTPIIKDKNHARRTARLLLISCVSSILKSGLGLLGIQAPEKI